MLHTQDFNNLGDQVFFLRYTSGPSSDECESDSENEIDDNLEESLKDESDPEEVKVPLERERTATDTKVDPPAKNYNASETKSELGETTQNETKITKSRVPILSGGRTQSEQRSGG